MQNEESGNLLRIWSELGIPLDYAERHKLLPQPQAISLVGVGRTTDDRELLLIPPAAAAWEQMQRSATNDCITLQIVSAFRSVARQAEVIRAKLAAGRSIDAILAVNAAPGYSEHHTGCALDLTTPGCPPLTEEFGQTNAFGWLSGHAAQFGFRLSFPRGNSHGIAFEPWHWCWADTNAAAKG